MTYPSALLTVSLLSVASSPFYAITDTYTCWYAFTSIIGGRAITVPGTLEEILESPEWSPASGSPAPVPVDRAIALAVEDFNRFVPDPQDWALGTVALMPTCRGKDHWVWHVTWQSRESGNMGHINISVLMSGRVMSLGRSPLFSQERPRCDAPLANE